MFNIGVIGSNSVRPLVKLTSRFMGFAQYPQVNFWADGRMDVGGFGYVTGEWYVVGPSFNIGSSYQIRYTHEAGSSPEYSPYSVTDAWLKIDTLYGRQLVWDKGSHGRVLIEIRNASTQKIEASARYWTSASMAP